MSSWTLRARLTAVLLGVVLVVAGAVVVLTRASDAPREAAAPATPRSTSLGGIEAAPSPSASVGTATQSRSAATERPPGDRASLTKRSVVPSPVPRASSRSGRLVRGYPAYALAPVSGSVIRTSSVSPSPGRVQVALDAKVQASVDRVLRHYAVRLGRYGFRSTPAPAVAGAQAASYRRGAESVVVTVTTTGSTAAYSVYATLRAKG